MGDRLEHLQGLALAVAIEPDTWIAFRRRGDGLVRIASCRSSGSGSFWIRALSPETRPTRRSWLDHVAAMAWSLREAALPVRGFDGIVDAAVPAWAGPAAAALELAVAPALLGGGPVPADAVLASLAQRAEHDYAGLDGAVVGQLVAAGGRAGRAMLVDCRSLETHLVPFPPGLAVVVSAIEPAQDGPVPADRATGGVADGASSEAAALDRQRQAECGRTLLLLAEAMPALASLRDLNAAALRRHGRHLPEPLARRAAHVVSENARVLATAAAMEAGNLDALGRTFAESHRSARSDFETGSPALDAMVELALGVRGVVAARMAGVGAGQCVVNLVLDEAVPALVAAVDDQYEKRTGLRARAFPVAVVDGVGPVAATGD
jgi:galactokinase